MQHQFTHLTTSIEFYKKVISFNTNMCVLIIAYTQKRKTGFTLKLFSLASKIHQ